MVLNLDGLQNSDYGGSEDLIDQFFTGKLWEKGLDAGSILIGRIEQESQPAAGQDSVTKKSLYKVRTTQGNVIPDCILLSPSGYGSFTKIGFSPDAVPGQYSKPYPGAFCVLGTAAGGTTFILGFFNPPTTVQTANDTVTNDQKPGVVEDVDARSSGDWIIRTENALLNIKRMGAVVLESGSSIRHTMNPLDGKYFTQSKSRIDVCEGYMVERGRIENTQPQALSTEDYFHEILQRGRSSTRVRIQNGRIDSTVRRELTISEINFLSATSQTETIKTRERYYDDGTWVGEGPKYQFGGTSASEPLVLGNKLVAVIKELSRIIKNIRVPTAWGPSGNPLPPTPVDLASLENDLDQILSDYIFATKSPASLETA